MPLALHGPGLPERGMAGPLPCPILPFRRRLRRTRAVCIAEYKENYFAISPWFTTFNRASPGRIDENKVLERPSQRLAAIIFS